MNNNDSTASQAEMKEIIKNFYVDVNEDKFTKVKVVNCKHKIKWQKDELSDKFMVTNHRTHVLKMGIDYRHKDEIDSVFFSFMYLNVDDGYVNMNDIVMYLILDDDKTIELRESSGYNYTSDTEGTDYIHTKYGETIQLAVPVSTFISIANANKIDYSIRFGQGALDGTFTKDQINLIKGFYNGTFDEDFEVESLYSATKTFIPEANTGSSSGCYIATMAYGSYEHPQVLVLRSFRDNYLASKKWGNRFICIYYKYSPKLVEKLKNQILINKTIRKILDLFIRFIK